MPRQIRDLGDTGWVHIVIRGINRENLFYDKEDYERFFSTLYRFQKETESALAACCLMSNHVHLLLFEKNNEHAELIRKVLVSYASYYNKKYDRVGHVFQDRFRSEPVEDEQYFLNVVRYIYQNPEKAGICSAGDYPYTYLNEDHVPTELFSTQEEWESFLDTPSDDRFLDYDSRKGYTDSEAVKLIESITGNSNPQKLQSTERIQRDEVLRQLKGKGLTIRQINRLTGINRNIVQRA